MKKKKNKRATNLAQARKEKEERLKEQLKDMDRFAGSSEEEDNVEEEENDVESSDEEEESSGSSAEAENDDDTIEEEEPQKKVLEQKGKVHEDSESSDEDEYGNVDNDSHDDDSETEIETKHKPSRSKIPSNSSSEKKAVGMSNAMAKILGMNIPSEKKKNKQNPPKSAILSKTKTKLQKQQEMEKKALQTLRQKRKLRRAEHLTSLHIPVGNMVGAPIKSSSTDSHNISQWEEITSERSYRRIATRGVVALFNAISKHQQAQREQQEQNIHGISKKHDQDVQSMTKRGFLDALKQTANKKEDIPNKDHSMNGSNNGPSNGTDTNTNTNSNTNESTLNKEEKDSSRGGSWNALRDDFMMGAKLKVSMKIYLNMFIIFTAFILFNYCFRYECCRIGIRKYLMRVVLNLKMKMERKKSYQKTSVMMRMIIL